MGKSRANQEIPDDIELLNIHAFPETVSAARLDFIRNSKICQRRLRELLRSIPGSRISQANPNILFQTEDDDPGAGETPIRKR